MRNSKSNSKSNSGGCGDHPLVVFIGILGVLIGIPASIFGIIVGLLEIAAFFNIKPSPSNILPNPTIAIIYTPTIRYPTPSNPTPVPTIQKESASEQYPAFVTALGSEIGSNGNSTNGTYQYNVITDNSGLLLVEVPTTWTDIDGSIWGDASDPLGLAVRAAPDLQAWTDTWITPGIFFGASVDILEGLADAKRLTMPDDVLDLDSFDYSASCVYDGRYEYSDPVYAGKNMTYGQIVMVAVPSMLC